MTSHGLAKQFTRGLSGGQVASGEGGGVRGEGGGVLDDLGVMVSVSV